MRRLVPSSLVLLASSIVACSPHATTSAPASSTAAPVVASPACTHASGLRAEAAKLDGEGHSSRARAKLDAANAECPSDRASSLDLELRVLASLGACADVHALAKSGHPALETCKPIEAASLGDARTLRPKLHEAYDAERTGDFAKAKLLYLAAWSEQHPNPRALESAARMAAAAGDAAVARRLRDRALVEAEATEHATARLSLRPHLRFPTLALSGRNVLLAETGQVASLDLTTGEYRLLLDRPKPQSSERLTVAATAMLAVVNDYDLHTDDVVDLLTGEPLAHVGKSCGAALAPDGSTLAVVDGTDDLCTPGLVRLLDPSTGAVKAAAIGLKGVTLWGFVNGSTTLAYEYDYRANVHPPDGMHLFDVTKRTGVPFAGVPDGLHWTYSPNGAYFAYIENAADHLRLRDVAANKELVDIPGHLYTVERIAIANDGKTLVSASTQGEKSSIRIYDVGAKKWTFTHAPGTDNFEITPDGKTIVLASRGVVEWDVATGAEKRRSSTAERLHPIRIMKAPEGAVAVLAQESVTIVKKDGELRTVCAQQTPLYKPAIQPTNVAFSASGKSFVCAMSDGALHVFETTGWTERAVVKRAAPGPTTEGDLAFSADDTALVIAASDAITEIDLATQKERKRTAIRHPKSVPLSPRHVRFADGTLLVQNWSGGASLFDAAGVWTSDVKLVAGVQLTTTPQAFAANGATYAAALDKSVHVVDLKSGTDTVTTVAAGVKALAVSSDGATTLAALSDGTVVRIAGGTSTLVRDHVLPRVALLGSTPVLWTTSETLVVQGAKPVELTMLDTGLVAQDDAGFEVRGTTNAICEVGHVFFARETCDDRARDGLLVAAIAALP